MGIFESLKTLDLGIKVVEKLAKLPIVGKYLGNQGASSEGSSVLVIGPGGVGKTTLGKFLNGQNRTLLEAHDKYRTSRDFEYFDVETTSNPAKLTIAFGQEHRLNSSWSKIGREIEDGKYAGIIYVGAYGYHSIGNLDWKDDKTYIPGNRPSQFLKVYTADRREIESNLLNRLIPHFENNSNSMWLLLFISKQDLWFKDKANVEKHYSTDNFAKMLEMVQGKISPNQFRLEVIYGSLTISNFVTGRGVELAKNSAGYGVDEQAESLNELVDTIDALGEWSNGNE